MFFPIDSLTKELPEYKQVVYEGKQCKRKLDFHFTREDSLVKVSTPVGGIEILRLINREDFVHCYQALAYQCAPIKIPECIGATLISGLTNWETVRKLQVEQIKKKITTGFNTQFSLNESDFKDSIIIISEGSYSGVEPETVGYSQNGWNQYSYLLRMNHELTHFVSRTLFPDNIMPIRDEIIADAIAIVEVFGEYRPDLAKMFLGITGENYIPGSRFEWYCSIESIPRLIRQTNIYMERIENILSQISGTNNKYESLTRLIDCWEDIL